MTDGDRDGRMARQADRDDPLASFASRFYKPQGTIYLDGNSLGLLSHDAESTLRAAVEQWRTLGIRGWLEADPPWFELAEHLGAELAPLIGAHPDEVIVTNSTTVNLHQLLATLYQPDARRPGILIDAACFPTDRYAIRSHLRLRAVASQALRIVPCREDGLLDESDIVAAMNEQVQMAVLPAVVFTTGQLLDLPRLTREAHRRGILIGFDCSHSVGVVPHALAEWDVDFAFFCTYKYLNGGPGAPAALYLNRRHFERAPGLAGWFGSRKDVQFDMPPELQPAPHAGRLQMGTPSILGLAPLLGALRIIREAGILPIREKSQRLTQYLRHNLAARCRDLPLRCVDPEEPARRGGHVAVAFDQADRLSAALRKSGVVVDFRRPNMLRLAPAPLYTSFAECRQALECLERIVRSGELPDADAPSERIP